MFAASTYTYVYIYTNLFIAHMQQGHKSYRRREVLSLIRWTHCRKPRVQISESHTLLLNIFIIDTSRSLFNILLKTHSHCMNDGADKAAHTQHNAGKKCKPQTLHYHNLIIALAAKAQINYFVSNFHN